MEDSTTPDTQPDDQMVGHPPSNELEFDDPVEAIKFHMELKGFTQKDLVPMIGSRSKVSEVLSGRRAITMPMARALHKHLEIRAEYLLQEPVVRIADQADEMDWRRFPLRQMANRGWIKSSEREHAEELVKDLMRKAGGARHATALYRKNDQNRANAKTDPMLSTPGAGRFWLRPTNVIGALPTRSRSTDIN